MHDWVNFMTQLKHFSSKVNMKFMIVVICPVMQFL